MVNAIYKLILLLLHYYACCTASKLPKFAPSTPKEKSSSGLHVTCIPHGNDFLEASLQVPLVTLQGIGFLVPGLKVTGILEDKP